MRIEFLSAEDYEQLWQKVRACYSWDSEGYSRARLADLAEGTGKHTKLFLADPEKPLRIVMRTKDGDIVYVEKTSDRSLREF